MQNKKCNFSKLFLSIILFVSCLFTAIVANVTMFKLSAADNIPYITINSSNHETKDSSGNYSFTNDTTTNLIVITINAYNIGNNEVVVKYYAEDASAICEAGDYYHQTSSVTSTSTDAEKLTATHELSKITFNSNKTTATVTYAVSQTANGTSYNNIENNRYFNFRIADITGGTIKNSQSTYQCIITNKHTIQLSKDSNGYYMSVYAGKFEKTYDQGEWHGSNNDKTANLNLIPTSTTLSGGGSITRTQVQQDVLDNEYANLYVYAYIHAEARISNWDELTFKIYSDLPGKQDSDDPMILYWHEKWVYDYQEDCEVKTTNSYKTGGKNYAIVDAKNGDAIRVVAHNGCNSYNRWADYHFTTYLSDDSPAEVTGTYIDASSLLVDGKIKLSIRFNEPVQVTDTDKLALIGKANGTTEVKFDYEAGNCTDTLSFVTTLKDSGLEKIDKNISYFTIDEIENFDTISDLGHSFKTSKPNFMDDYDFEDIFEDYNKPKCTLDLRTPTINAISTKDASAATTSRTVDLKIGNVSKATLYYSWTKNKTEKFTTVKDYASSIDITGDKDSEVTKSLTLSDVNGEYYLHICIQNIFGKTATFTYGSGGLLTTSNSSSLRGYRLDNSTPTVENVNLYSDTLTSKVFDLRIADGKDYSDGGIETVYISIKTSSTSTDYSDYPIYSTNPTIKSTISTDIALGDRADVYYMDSELQFVTYANKSSPSYYNGNQTSHNSLIFSSKAKAYEYFYDKELTDFGTILLTNSNTAEVTEIKNKRAYGETQEPAVGDVWIKYKTSTFKYDGSYDDSDWVYYYYSGTNADIIDLSKALQNTRLLEAVKNAANLLTDKGSTKNLYTIDELINDYNLVSIPNSQVRKSENFVKTVYGKSFLTSVGYTDEDINLNSTGGHFTLRLDYDSDIINCPSDSYVDLYIGFYVVDAAENSSRDNIVYKKYRFDNRVLFDCNMSTNSQTVLDSIEDIMVYDTDASITFSYTVNESDAIIGNLEIAELYCYDAELTNPDVRLLDSSEYSKYFTISYDKYGTYQNKITIKPKYAGYAKIELTLNNSGTKKKHDPYEFYFTNNLEDNTNNYLKSLNNRVLVNNVYKLSQQYSYMDGNGSIHYESYGSEDTGNVYFSSLDSLKDYVEFMEYQDLQLVVLNPTMAESLASGGIGTYTKADGETSIPQAGQTWIRYKIPSWTIAATQTAWVYYFYNNASSTSILTNKISSNLKNAISTVVTSIVGKAVKVNLVNGSYIDEYGSPVLEETEIHPSSLNISHTKTNSLFTGNIQYSGDVKLFDSTVRLSVDGITQDIPILTNQKLLKAEKTHIYFAYYNGQDVNSLEYNELIYNQNDTYREAINKTNGTNGASGIYFIREVSISGIHEYIVYIDNLAPTLNIKFTTPNSTVTTSRALNSESNGFTFGCKTFTISTINSNIELDKYAYVIVYTSDSKVSKILYASDLEAGDYTLSNGSWTIYVNDRSGNSYVFKVSCSTTKLTLDVAIDDSNDFVKVAINRYPEEIYRYQVFLNGTETPLDDVWSGSPTQIERYRESGFYYVYVQDIYGYILEQKGESGSGIVFERTLPNVIWSYLDYDDSSYEPYNEGITDVMSMYKSLGNVYYISTSRPIKLKMTESYKYEIKGLDLDSEVSTPTSKDIMFGNVSDYLKSGYLKDFEITLWYEDYPDITVTYIITCDTVSPDIFLVYSSTSWDNYELQYIENNLNNFEEGYVYYPETIDYYARKEVVTSIANGSSINANLITLNIEDLSGVKAAYVYLTEPNKKEELLMELTPEYGMIENVSLSRYGTYRIVAVDVFGNMDEMTFTNTADDRITASVDNNDVSLRNKQTNYGNSNATIKLLQDGQLAIQVKDETGNYIYFIKTENGVAYLQEYKCTTVIVEGIKYKIDQLENKQIQVLNASGKYVYQDEELFSIEDPVFNTVNTFYKVLSKYDTDGIKINPFTLYVSYDKNNLLTFKVVCDDDDIEVTYRAFLDYSFEPYLIKSKLSNRLSDVTLLDKEHNQIEVNNSSLANTNTTFKIDPILDKEIVKVEISYSDVKDFKDYTVLYPYTKINEADTKTFGSFDTSKNGFYSIRITNVYGNVNTYTINRSDVFLVIYSANYDDGDYTKLSKDFVGTIKANDNITVEAYSDNVKFVITKTIDGKTTTTQTTGIKFDGYTQLTLTEEATYKIQVIDLIFGNKVEVNGIIENSKLIYDPGLLIGYNEKALLKEEGYTNNKLTIVKQKVLDLNIKYIEIKVNDESYVLYDSMNNEVDIDESVLIDAIGNNGDGVYYVIFKDEFGSKVVKEIHYALNSPFTISRKISSSLTYELLEINEKSLENGFWCNDAFLFDTTATVYKFMVNEISDECSKTLAFADGVGNGTIPYNVYYIDEYGFEFSFKATLDRRDLSITLKDTIETVLIDDILNTSDPLSIKFSDGYCYYSINGVGEYEYKSKEILYQDGAYRFNCFDKSGNATSLVVIKDSKCSFDFVVDGGTKSLIDGEACNASYVTLVSDDKVKITKYYIDGVKQEDLEIEKFSKAGHYYMFLEDGIGNSSVFEFYLISHNISSFTYQTPNTYLITELWFSGKDGTFTNYLATGKVIFYSDYCIIDNVTEDGDYQVVMTSSTYKKGISFSFTIDTSKPDVSLKGTDGITKTVEDVTLEGCEEGDTITIYKDGELYGSIEVTYNSDPLTITDGGKYRIVVRNQAGNETELTFEKIRILNNSGSILVIIGCLAFVIGIIIGVCLKNKQKYDE